MVKTMMVVKLNEQDPLDVAKEEMKRADHLIFVSLKYTRTVDVLKSIVERLVNAFDASIIALLEHAVKKKRLEAVPQLLRQRIDLLKELYPDQEELQHFCELYLILRKIAKARVDRSQEYRRHVTMTAYVDNEQVEVTIDIITDYFEKTKEFVALIEKITA